MTTTVSPSTLGVNGTAVARPALSVASRDLQLVAPIKCLLRTGQDCADFPGHKVRQMAARDRRVHAGAQEAVMRDRDVGSCAAC
jgi:hypothetical protein